MRTYMPFILAALVLALASFALGSIAQDIDGAKAVSSFRG